VGGSLVGFAVELGERRFIMGAEPCSLDATLAGFLSVLLHVPLDNPLKAHAASLANIAAYAERMRSEYWPR